MDGGAWWAAVHGVVKSWTRLSNFTFTFHFHALEKEMATYSSVLAWRIPGTEEPGGLCLWGHTESDTTEWLHFHFSFSCIGEGIGNPLQCSCLENPRDGGAWWAAIHCVAQSQTWLKQLSSSSSQCRRHRNEGSIPRLGRSPRGGHGYPLQNSRLENSLDRGACWVTVQRVTKSRTQLKQLSTHARGKH